MVLDSVGYNSAFGLLLRDFLTLCQYVEPHERNLETFSHRLYEILLRASTECESIWKDLILETEPDQRADRLTVNDYRTLEAKLHLESIEVGWHIWRPAPIWVRPFADWSVAGAPLHWYADYNRVKHNRNAEFHLASLKNARLAVSAVFTLVARLDLIPDDGIGLLGDARGVLVDYRFAQYPQVSYCSPDGPPAAVA